MSIWKLPRITTASRAGITPAQSEIIYDTDLDAVYIGDGSTAGGNPITGSATVPDGDKGDITVSASGATWTIDNDAVTYSKMQNVSATDRILGRSSSGAGDVEEITCTSFARSLLDDSSASAARTTLGLGSLATQSGTFSGTSSGTNTGDQTITLTGDVTGSGTGSFAATLANSGVSAGSYTSANITVDAKGRVTSASNGSGGSSPTTTKGDLIARSSSADSRLAVGADGRSLIATSNDTLGMGWYEQGIFCLPGYVSGRIYIPWITGNNSTGGLTANTMHLVPYYVSKRQTWTDICCFVTASTPNARLGIYTNNNGVPDQLVSGSEIGSTALVAAAQNNFTFSSPLTLSPGWYWMAIVTDGSATLTGVGASGQNAVIMGLTALVTSASGQGVRVTASHTFGALPSTCPSITYTEATSMVTLGLKAQ